MQIDSYIPVTKAKTKLDDSNKTVIVYAIGHRKDIYEVISELIR